MTSRSFKRMAVERCDIKRSPVTAGGRIGTPVAYLSDLPCTPIDPVDAEVRQRPLFQAINEIVQTFISTDETITEGMLLVNRGVTYTIRAVEDWTHFRNETYLRLIMEQVKRA
jgi:hypothetical protein